MKPLADKLRPVNLDMVVGQKHLLGEEKPLKRLYDKKELVNMIFYGPPGTGKTTVAMLMAQNVEKNFYKINATNAGTSDIKDLIKENDGKPFVLYVDEIQHFNKKQQQSLLEFVEIGQITLIASTTENPAFYIFEALLSRCHIFEFKEITKDDIKEVAYRSIDYCETLKDLKFDEESIDYISEYADGDVRKCINLIELCSIIGFNNNDVTVEALESIASKKIYRHDKDGNSHYDTISAFQKSIRGSDPDAAVHYLARLILGGDIKIISRRLLVIASEDIGLAHPNAVAVVNGCVEAALKLGLPEARIPLAEATIFLATCPKSNTAITAIDEAINDLKYNVGEIPDALKDSHYSRVKTDEYLYPHAYENNYVEQQYLPDSHKDRKYYDFGKNKYEQGCKSYWDVIKKK